MNAEAVVDAGSDEKLRKYFGLTNNAAHKHCPITSICVFFVLESTSSVIL